MLPQNVASSTDVVSPFLSPDNQVVEGGVNDIELGGFAIGDASRGMQFQPWYSTVDDLGRVRLHPVNAPPTIVHTQTGITEVSFSFDQNMRPVVAMVVNGLVRLRWYDTIATGYVITDFPGTRSPKVALDDKRQATVSVLSDVIFAYIKDGDLCYRQQRDRYTIEYTLRGGIRSAQRLVNIGMNESLRMQFEVQ